MTPEQALQILSNVTAKIPLVRADHQAVEQALVTISRVLAAGARALSDRDKELDKREEAMAEEKQS